MYSCAHFVILQRQLEILSTVDRKAVRGVCAVSGSAVWLQFTCKPMVPALILLLRNSSATLFVKGNFHPHIEERLLTLRSN